MSTPRFGRETGRTRYVVGFAFNPERSRVALISKKQEPTGSDMIGTFNGLGGAVLSRETYLEAMRREFKEESGAFVTGWQLIAITEGDTFRLFVYAASCSKSEWRKIRTLGRSVTDEQVVKVPVRRVFNRPLRLGVAETMFYPDVPFLVALALDALERTRPAARFDWRQI